jgi:hypothetical protein
MNEEYLFVFAYESPMIRSANERRENYEEQIGAFRISAESERRALAWGRELARWYADELFGKGKGNWSDSNYQSWIEPKPEKKLEKFAKSFAVVAFGEYPDINVIRKAFSD